MAQKLISISDPNLIQSGIVKSLHKLQVPLWVDGQNVIFEDGSVRKSPGFIAIFTALGTNPIIGIQDVLVQNTPNLLFGDIEALYRWDGTSLTTEATGFTGSLSRAAFQSSAFASNAFQVTGNLLSSLWSMTNFGTWALASNGIDPIQIDKMLGAGAVALSGTPPTYAAVIIHYINYIIAFNTDLGGEFAEWCDTDNPEDWVNGAAGFLPIRDLDSVIVAVASLGTSIAVYGNNSLALFQYIGPPFYFGAKKVLEGIGSVGKFAVVSREGLNYGLSKQGFWRTDGSGYDYISPPFLRKWLEDHVNWGQAFKVAGFLNEDRSLIEWGISIDGASEPNVTVCYNFDSKTWTFRNYGITSAVKKGVFTLPVFGDKDGKVYYGEYGFNADTSALDAWAQTRPLPGDNHLAWKDIEFFISYMTVVSGNVSIEIGVQENLDDEITWSNPITLNEDSNPQYSDTGGSLGAGRYISLKIRSTGLEDDWRIAGFDIYGAETGSEI